MYFEKVARLEESIRVPQFAPAAKEQLHQKNQWETFQIVFLLRRSHILELRTALCLWKGINGTWSKAVSRGNVG